ncbi:MAG: hypothetical protein NTZ50_07405 [Chloroflexi bacterium]|nr:hypothetical protein [Chloroflexota bacterium]
MRASPERTAWTVLFAALFTCVALAVGVPASILGYVNNATNAAYMRLSLQSGILTSYSPAESIKEARVVDLAGREFKEEHTVVAGDRSVGLLTFAPNATTAPYIHVQLYSNAQATIKRARVPRFLLSNTHDELTLVLSTGRIDLLADPPANRAFVLQIEGATGTMRIDEAGQYSIEMVDGAMHVRVHQGAARLATASGAPAATLLRDQSAMLTTTGKVLIQPTAPTELVRNGFFHTSLLTDWQFKAEVNASDAVRGTASRINQTTTNNSTNGTLLFERSGDNIGWGRTSLTQQINQSVQQSKDMRLRIVFAILEQQLEVCGSEGTECPLMVRIDYTTKDGRDDFWLQGFYAKGDPSVVKLPDYVRSNFRGNHIAKPLGMQQVYETENLLQQLGQPRTVKSITIYAEGHALRTRVDSVELLEE